MANKPMTFDHLRSRKKPVTKRLTLVSDHSLADEVDAQEREVQRLRNKYGQGGGSELDAALAVLGDLRGQMKDNSVTLTFQSIGRSRYEALIEKHPITEATRELLLKEGLDSSLMPGFDPESFSIALIAASCTDPIMSEEQVAELRDDPAFNKAEYQAMFEIALEVNATRRIIELGKG